MHLLKRIVGTRHSLKKSSNVHLGIRPLVSKRFNTQWVKSTDNTSYDILNQIRNQSSFDTSQLLSVCNQYKRKAREALPSLDKKSFCELMKSLGVNDESVMERSFQFFDSDKNGFIDFREFAAGMSIITRGSIAEKYDFAFRVWDNDNDGCLDREEFEHFLGVTSTLKPIDPVLMNRIWSELDVDGTGKISWAECRHGIAKLHLVATPMFFEDTLDISLLSQQEKEILYLIAERIHLTKGEIVLHQDSYTPYFFVLINGEVEISRNDYVVTTLQKEGEVFGGENFVSMPCIKRITCVSKTVDLWRIAIDDLLPLIFHSHVGAIKLLKRVCTTLIERIQKISAIAVINENLTKDKRWIEYSTRILSRIALFYQGLHRFGKLEVRPTKTIGQLRDFSIAYSPGVAEPCLAIKTEPSKIYEYTAKEHLVAVVTNGSSVLGLGNIGPSASKPAMEGKAVLFKKFGGLDAYDIEIDEQDPERFVAIVQSLEPTFGAINIEDIKSPDCFYIEKELQKRCKIPIMHDDQHGTAVVAGASLLNALDITKKRIQDIKVVINGCGAAGYCCANFFISLGVNKNNLFALDSKGVVHKNRFDIKDNPSHRLYHIAQDTEYRTLEDVIVDADVFLGASIGGALKPELLHKMNEKPFVCALANPIPEISYNVAKRTRNDILIATGRPEFPNQINNVSVFPYIFRAAMDVRSSLINEEMKQAACRTISNIARDTPERYGADYLIPEAHDPRLKIEVTVAVAIAAMESGVATKHLDLEEYRTQLMQEIS
eukprot:TRINITY_DN3935_c0_g1_i1.p1 TRINITY_DN3935_c0_g1~~TRINITY_DN3935_c0_g1_i1.p1  ORF type:complete len:773 (+),score=124.68 TRINITY_DN3935_c0_g1_i1:28-2346(+)